MESFSFKNPLLLLNPMSEKRDVARREEDILTFWNAHNIFEKTLTKDAPKGEFVFYDGPPFATGLPHYGHLMASTVKDVVPRYKTMKGYRVPRRWGWDCHGLPLEAQVEKELGVQTKADILQKVGIKAFNEKARSLVMTYRDEWKKTIPRIGRFVDMENDYRTMDPSYMESVWWVFKTLYDKGLVYRGFKSLHLSPVLGTELSNMEVAQGYREITDFAVTVRLPIKGQDAELLVWTTTPWTLPGNMAAAVHPELHYVTVKVTGSEKQDGTYVLAKDRLDILEGLSYEIVDEQKGEHFIGKEYEPPFAYYQNESFEHKENAWKIYGASYVEADAGTGAVHLAPAFGPEDLELAQEEYIPVVHHVDTRGRFVETVKDFAGMEAKPKDSQDTDVAIIKALAHSGKLFAKEKISHRYPHSWRTDEPLLNYAMNSWFVQVSSIKDTALEENAKVNWNPAEVGAKRFGNWIKDAPDWSISRSRFWGAPLPVWEAKDGGRIVVGSIEELKRYTPTSGNSYFVMRHGEALSNTTGFLNDDDSQENGLTDAGKKKVRQQAAEIKQKGISKIVVSPLLRTQETAKIIAEELGLSEESVLTDERLREIEFGIFNGKPVKEYHDFFKSSRALVCTRPEGGESWCDVKVRVGDALYELERKYQKENILLITHNSPAFMLARVVQGDDVETCAKSLEEHDTVYLNPGEYTELPFVPIPHNDAYELDLHRPYIDEVTLEKDGKVYDRIPEVFDCWFESGSMPYAQAHFPFEKDTMTDKPSWFERFLGAKQKGYPAGFIAESLDQTRGWFYSLLMLGVGVFGSRPYENVNINGIILAEDGQKMSKKLQNYPDPSEVINEFGADALRYYFLSSPLMRGEDLNFSKDGVREAAQKIIGRTHNIYAFFELYEKDMQQCVGSTHVLDEWIMARLSQTILETEKYLDVYQLDKASRPLADFIDDFSTWYLRRSRDRIKAGDTDAGCALYTLKTVLHNISLVMAPFTPFYAEYLYQRVRKSEDPESVHLASWPAATAYDTQALHEMEQVRGYVSDALELRQQAGIKVRQPLASVSLPTNTATRQDALQNLIKEEVNVEEVLLHEHSIVSLDTEITHDLQKKGDVRELMRALQGARKDAGFSPQDIAKVIVYIENAGLITDAQKDIEAATNTKIQKVMPLREAPGDASEVSLSQSKAAFDLHA